MGKLDIEDENVYDDDNDDLDIDTKKDHKLMLEKLTVDSADERQFKWKSKRSEISSVFSQFAFPKSSKSNVVFPKLTKLTKDNVAKKSLRNFHLKKVIDRPLKKPVAERAARQVNFKLVSEEISKYDTVVKENRNADQLVFVDQMPVLNINSQIDLKPNLDDKNCLETVVYDHLTSKSENFESNNNLLTEKELELLKSRNLDEARLLHQQIQKRRLLISYQEAKFRRMRKIKSKKYHRLLKKDKLKKTVDEFDQLVAENSDKAVEKLEELDRLRALERASLKHMNTGKWAKHNKLRAKYDDQARESLNEQLKINEEMRKKRSLSTLETKNADNNEETDQDPEKISNYEYLKEILKQPNLSPWFTSNYKNFEVKLPPEPVKPTDNVEDNTEQFFRDKIEKRIKESKTAEINQILQKDDEDEAILFEGDDDFEDTDFTSNVDIPKIQSNSNIKRKMQNNGEDNNENSDVEEFNPDLIENMKLPSNPPINRLNTLSNVYDDDGEIDDINFHNEDAQNYLHDIFDGEDVVQEFLKAKKDNEDKEFVSQKESLYMPGWGSWAGHGIKVGRKKKSKIIKQVSKKNKRHNEKICNAIVLTDVPKDPKYRIAHRPANIDNVKQFEQKCLKPIGSNWNPETISCTLSEPKVVTKIGTIIKPMSAIGNNMKL